MNLNLTLEIVINDPDVDDSDVVDTIQNATDSYLATLSAKYVYNLTVTLINKQNDVLSVNIFVQSEGELNELDEEEVFEECDKEIDSKYGDRADVKNPYSPNDYSKTSEYLLYAVAGLTLIVICCGVMIIGLCVKMKHKSTHSDKARSELCLSVTSVSLADVRTNDTKHSDENSDEGENSSDDEVDEIEDNDDDDDDEMYEVVSTIGSVSPAPDDAAITA